MKSKKIIYFFKNEFLKRFSAPPEGEAEYIRRQLKETKEQIEIAHLNFNDASDNDMISYYSYMIKAFEVKYNSLIKRAKELNISG